MASLPLPATLMEVIKIKMSIKLFTKIRNGVLFQKLFWPTDLKEKKCYCDREKLLKFESEVWDFARTIYSNNEKAGTIFQTKYFFKLFFGVSQIWFIREIIIQIEKNYWDLETSRKIFKNLIFF